MPQYLETLKQLGLKDLATQKGKGRVSSLSSISKQFFKTHYDGYHPRMSRHLATTLKRYISTRPKHERRTSEFVGEVRRKLLCLHEYNVQIAKVKFKYPRTEQLDALLIQYIELECGLLYDSYKDEVDETVEDEVRQRILRLLKVILHDALHNSEVPLKTTVKACDKALLKLFASVRVDCMTENNLIAKVILKLLDKLNLLDEVNQLKGKNIPFHQDTVLKDQLVCRVRQNLTTSDYESNFDDSDEEEVEVTSIVHDDMFNYAHKPLFNDYIGKRDEKIKYAHLNREPFKKEFSSLPYLSQTNQVTRLNDGFPSKIKCLDNCDDIFASDSSTRNSKNATHEADSQTATVCSDVNDSVFPSDCSRSSFEQKTIKLVDFENTMTLSNNENNPKYPKEDMLSSSTFEKQKNCLPEPVSRFQELNLAVDHQNEVQDSGCGNMEDVHKKTTHQFEEIGTVYENNKESDLISAENNSEVQTSDPQSNGKIGNSQSEIHVSNAEDENFFGRDSIQIQEVQRKENNWISENTDVNDVLNRHENKLNEATTQLPDSLNNNKETYSEVQDDNNPQDNIRENISEKTSANKAMDQSNSMLEVPIFDTTQTESRKLDETPTSIPVTIDLDSLPDTNGLRSTKTSVSERITNGLVTIEILDDDDDEEADYTCISFNERQSQLKNNMADNLIQTQKIKVEDSEENHSSNFPISHTENGSQNFMDSNKTPRSSNSTNQNILKDNSTNDSVRDIEIVISDSEDDSVEIVSNKCIEKDDELTNYCPPKENLCVPHLEIAENVCVETGDTTMNNSSMQTEDMQNIIPQDEVPHIEEESLNQDENVNAISDAAATITNEESTEVGTEDGVTCEEINLERDTTNCVTEEPSEDKIEQQREVTSIHEESADTPTGLNSEVAEEVTTDIQDSEITTAAYDDTSHLIQEDSHEIQDLEDTCTINDQTDEMIIEDSVEAQNNSEHTEQSDKVNTSTESIEFDEVSVTSPEKCEENKEELLNVQETDQGICEDKNMNLSSDMSSTGEHIEECEETSQLLLESESVVATETFEDINNEERDEEALPKLNEHEDQNTLEVTVETDISNNAEIEIQINTNIDHENVNTCDQEEKIVNTVLEETSNVTDDKVHETLVEPESDKQDDQQEDSVSEDVGEEQAEVVYCEPDNQFKSEDHSEQSLIENSEIRSEIIAENASHNESTNEMCPNENIINEQIVTEASEISSTPVTTSNFIDASESTDLQQKDYSSQNFGDQNIRDTGSDHSKETENTESTYHVIDYSRTTPYTLPISNDTYNNMYSNCENGHYNTQKHNMEIYSMENNMHQTVSTENETKIVQNLVHTQIVQEASIPQKVQPQEGVATTTINESFYYKSNISSTLNEVEYVEYDTEKKVNLELLANIAVNQETLEVKTEPPLSDTSQETPKRRKSKVRLDYKKKMFSRETLPRAVKQFPKKIPKKKPDEGIENNRITRNRINKIKANAIALNEVSKSSRVHGRMDSKYKPHDFISVENPTIPPPTNNVYAQKRLMETNTTSEDSNDSCESTLFIDLGDKITEKSVKSVFEEETIDDMLEFVSTEEKAAVCISIPDNEDNCVSDSDSFQILKQIEDFVDNSQQSSVSSLTKEPSEQLDEVASVKNNTEEPSLTAAETISQVVEDTLNNSSDKDLVTKEDVESNLESKTIKTTNHSIEHILNKTTGMNEVNVVPVNYSKEDNIESSNNDKCDVTSSQIQPAELNKEVVFEFNRTEDVQKTSVNLCNGTILQTTFENYIEKSNTDIQSDKSSFKDDTSATPIEEIKETAEDNEQLQPENLSMNKCKFSSPRPEENSEKIFKTKAAMKAYEDKLQPELPVNSEKTDSTEVTSESSLESPLRVDTGDSSIDKNDLNTSPISTTSFSSEIEVASELNQSEEMKNISCEHNINVSTDSANTTDDSTYDTPINLTMELSVDTKEFKDVTNNLPTPQATEILAKCKDDDKTSTVLNTESSQEQSKLDNAKQDLEKPQVPVFKALSATETSVVIDKNVVITEVECFNSELFENRDEFTHTNEKNKTQVNKDESTIDDSSKHESLNISPTKSTHSTPEKAKSSKIPDEEKGRMLENTIKKMKEKIVESERAKKEQKSENKSEEKKSSIQKDESHSVRDKSSSDRKHHKTSSKSNHSDDVKDKSNDVQKKDSGHRKRHSRSPSKSRTSDKKQDPLNNDKEKLRKDSPGRSTSKSKSTDKRSKHHSDGENERKRRSKSISVDEKEKIIETSDQENVDRKRRSRSSSKSKSSDSKTKHISTDKALSKHKSSESKDKHSSTDDGKDSHKKRRSSKSPSKSKSSDKNDKKTIDVDKNKVRDKSETSKTKSSSTKTEIKSKNDTDLQVKDKSGSDKDKRHEGHKSSKSKDSSKTEVQSSQEKQNEPQRKDEHVKNDKSRRSHSKENTKIENNSRAEKREKSISSTKERHKENKKSKHSSEESKEPEVGTKSKKGSDKKPNNLCKENKENASYTKKDKHSEKKLSDHHGHGEQKEQKENTLTSAKKNTVDNFENASSDVDLTKHTSKQNHINENEQEDRKCLQTDVPKKRKHEVLEENDKNLNNDDLSKPKIPKSDIVIENDVIEKSVSMVNINQEMEKEESGVELNDQKIPVLNNESSEISTSVPVEINEDRISTPNQNDKSVPENLTSEDTQNNIEVSSDPKTTQENLLVVKENPLTQLSEQEAKAMEIDTISQPILPKEDKISNDISNNNKISHITSEQDNKLKLVEVGPPEEKEPETVPESPSKVIVQDAILPEITSSEPVYVPNTYSTSVTIDMQVLTSSADSTVKHFHVEPTALPTIPNVTVTAISTSTITSKEISIPITIQSTPSCSTSGIQEKPVLFTFNPDGEIDALGLEDISPTKLPIGTNPSLDLISPSTSMSEISNSMNLVQTLGTSTINFISDPEIDIQQTSKQNSFAPNFTRGTRVTEIRCFVEKESTADHNYTLGDPLLGGNNEDKNILTTGLSLSNSPEEFPLNGSHLEELTTFNENNFMEENGTLDDLGLLLPCKKEKPDFDNIIDEAIPKPEDIENSIKRLNMLVDNSQSGQPKAVSVDNTANHTTPSDCSYSLGTDYAVNQLLFLRGSEVTSQNNSFPIIPDIENISIMESNLSSSHQSKETTEDSINMRSHDETANINAICNSYANFMPPVINQKVVVEPVEHCIITSLDQLEKDYNNINETCDRVEKNHPNAVTNSETNIGKTSTQHKSNKFATFLQTVKKMDAQRNEAPKVKDEMENYTVRRHNRTPVFPPKKKTVTQQQHTKSPPESKKSEILLFDTAVPVSTSQTTELNECRIRVKTDLMKPPEPKSQVVDSLSSLDYINEHDQNVASEVVLPFSKPSPSEKICTDLKEKNSDSGFKVDGEIAKTSKHARFDKAGNDYIMENILNSHNDAKTHKSHTPDVKVCEKQQDNVTEVNKKRKSTLSDNSDTSDNERYSKRADKRQKKSDDEFDKIRTSTTDHGKQHNKKSLETVVTPANNDEIFDKLLAEGPVNKVFAQRMTEQQQKPQQKNENGPSNVSSDARSDVSKNRGYSTAPDGYKKAKVVPSPPVPAQLHESSKHRENVRHPHPDVDKRREQRKPGYHQGTYNPPLDRRYVDKRHGTLPVIENSPKRFIRNSTNPYSSKSDPCTSRGQPYKSRDRRSSTEHLNSLLPNKKEGTVMKDDDEFSWLTKLADTGVVDTPSNLFMPPGTKREDSRK